MWLGRRLGGLAPRTFVLGLFVVAFLIRLAVVLWLRDLSQGPHGPSTNDDYEFNVLAENTAAGAGYVNDKGQPTSFRLPGFPLLLSGLYSLVGPSYPLAYVFFCVLGALSCVLTYVLAREVLSEAGARVAGLLSAVYLGHAYFATTFLSENSFVPLLTAGLWFLIRFLKGGSSGLLALAGLTLGLATLTRSFALLLWPLFGLLLLASHRGGRRWAVAAIWTVTFLGVLLPWTARNYAVHGELVLLSTNGGSTFYGGNNPRVVTEPRYFGYWVSTVELPHRDLIEAAPTESAHDRVEWRLGAEWMREHPAAAAFAVPLNLARLAIGLPDFEAGGRLYYLLRMIGYWPFLALCLAGGLVCLRRRLWELPWRALHLTMLATLLTAVIFWGSPRFRDVNVALLMIYATLGLHSSWARAEGMRDRSQQ